ncbi:MAG: hypothetical protein R3C49_21715 [Planctomycetaceae bacterium]
MEPRQRLDYKLRDQAIVKLCHHACTIEDIQEEIRFDSYKTTARRMATLCKRGVVEGSRHRVAQGYRAEEQGVLYFDIRPDRVRHELYLTKRLLKQECDYVVRYGDVDATLRPDAELHFEDGVLFAELDTGTESHVIKCDKGWRFIEPARTLSYGFVSPEKRMLAIKSICPFSQHLFSLWNTANFL